MWDVAGGTVTVTRQPGETHLDSSELDRDRNTMYVDEMRHFLRCAATGHNEMNPVASAAATTDVALQVLEQGGLWQEKR